MHPQLSLFDAEPDSLSAHRNQLQQSVIAMNTAKGYAHDWKVFRAWCRDTRHDPLPATTETVTLYLTELIRSGRKVSTAVRRTSGISYYHRLNGYDSPVTQRAWDLLSGARRMLKEQPRQMRPMALDDLRAISAKLRKRGTPEALRDRAVVMLGFATALRRASLAELRLSDVTFTPKGLVVQVRHEKQDQQGKGREIGVPFGKRKETCAPSCLRAWLAVRGEEDGPLFTHVRIGGGKRLSPATIGRIVKSAVQSIGLDPAHYAGHSLRSGFITAAGEAGVGELLIASQTGHRSMEILRRYFRRTNLFRSNACAALDL